MQTATNYENIIPNNVLFNLKQLEEINIIKTPTAKKLINQGKLEAVKIGNKLHISRAEIIRYLENRTVRKFCA